MKSSAHISLEVEAPQEVQAVNPLAPKLTSLLFGADYNPEQWPEETWREDVRLMREAGVNLVSLGIFSWALLEPRPGEYNFGWLDRIMDLLYENRIMVDLATATASPPPWLARLYPESRPVTASGTKLWPGSRQQYCPSSPAYRQAARQLVFELANRYKARPALAMWHIGNEYGCHVSECFCDNSAGAFKEWLKKRYRSLESLNDAWGTAFWSQRYTEWEEINPPRQTPTFINPTQQLDWKRFCSEALLECFEQECAILKELTPDIPITTNFMSFFKPLDYWKWSAREDLVSLDSYPDPAVEDSYVDAALNYDLMRSLGGGKPWLLMEQTTSQVNWRAVNALKRPGQQRAWSYQALARGANGVMYFQWRASKAGAEKFHSGLVPHVGTENSRVWREVRELGQELKGLDELLPTTLKASVAIMFDWENWWALELDAKPSQHLKMVDQLKSYYAPLYRKNIAVDFVPPWGDLSQYKLILVPNLYLIRDKDGVAARLEEFVASGGQLVVSFFSGIVDENDHIRLGGYPAPFRRLLGLVVEEFDPASPGQSQPVLFQSGEEAESYQSELWVDIIHLEGAQAMAVYENGYLQGRPALTRNSFGKGSNYYWGCRPNPALMTRLLDEIIQSEELEPLTYSVQEGIEITRRESEKGVYIFVINHNHFPVDIEITPDGYDLLSRQAIATSKLKLLAFGVAILKYKV